MDNKKGAATHCCKCRVFQQGDVVLRMVSEIPAELQVVKPGPRGNVLAEGETTGHAHTISAQNGVTLFTDPGTKDMYLQLDAPTTIRHEEHKHIELPAGKFKIGIVTEVDPFTEELNRVRD